MGIFRVGGFLIPLKTKDRKIRGNCNLLTKVKFHELEWSSPLSKPKNKDLSELMMINKHYLCLCHNITFGRHLAYSAEELPNRPSHRSSYRRYSVKKVFLEISQTSQENTCARDSIYCNFIKKEYLALTFSCEFCKIFKNTFFTEQLGPTASKAKWVKFLFVPRY